MTLNNYRNHFFLVLSDRESKSVFENNVGMSAFETHNDKNIALIISKSADDDTITHEFVHGFGIKHPFNNDSNYTYMHGKYSSINSDYELTNNTDQNDITDNLMDYFITHRTLYKWQWDKMIEDINKIR